MIAALALKATLVFTLALAASQLRSLSAAVRHRMVAAAFVAAIVLPAAALWGPARVVRVTKTSPARVLAAPVDDVLAPAPAATTSRAFSERRSMNGWMIVAVAYGAVTAFFLLSLAASVARLLRLRARAQACPFSTDIVDAEVLTSTAIAVPMTFRSTILLPDEARNWSDTAIRRALRHEVEHIARRDWLIQVIARVACALYWPHPQVWMLWSRLRLDAERACDDAVIRSGAAGELYAAQLVDLARRLSADRSLPALGMATTTNLASRVESILDATRRRNAITRSASFAVFAGAAFLLFAIAPLRVAALPAPAGIEADADDAPLDFGLLKIARAGDIQTMRSLLDRGARPDVAFRGDGTALIEAARGGHVDAITMLLNAGADPDHGVRGDGNALTAAAERGHIEAVKVLLDSGADVNAGIQGDGNALIMASGAGQLAVVKLLLDRGASLEFVVAGDENALIHASENGRAAVAEYLIQRGANVNARAWSESGDGESIRGEWRTPLLMARRNHHDDVVRILLKAGARD